VVVGSALVRIIEDGAGSSDLARDFGRKALELSDALR
jgi:tryptophan synthase alpha subunit